MKTVFSRAGSGHPDMGEPAAGRFENPDTRPPKGPSLEKIRTFGLNFGRKNPDVLGLSRTNRIQHCHLLSGVLLGPAAL